MSQFDHESDDQSALANELVRDLRAAAITAGYLRADSIELLDGIIHLAEGFRRVARAANLAGIEGYKFLDAEMGLDIEEYRARMKDPNRASNVMNSRVLITYRKTAAADDGLLAWMRKQAPETVKVWELAYTGISKALRDASPQSGASPPFKV